MAEIERRKAYTVEKWYTARSLSLCPPIVSTGFTVSLRPPLPLPAILARVETILPRLSEFHPWLGGRVEGWEDGKGEKLEMSLIEEDGKGALRVVHGEEGGGMEDVLHQALESPINLEGRLWEVFLYVPGPSSDTISTVYLGASIHHLLADGLSTHAVTRTLLLLVNDPSLALPSPAPEKHLPAPVETLLDIRPGWRELGPAIFKAFLEPWLPTVVRAAYAPKTVSWLGNKPTEPRGQHHITTFVPLPTLKALLRVARENKTTLNALVHTAAVLAVLPLITPGTHVSSNTPASLLPHIPSLPPSASAGGVYVGARWYIHSTSPSPPPLTIEEFVALAEPYATLTRDSAGALTAVKQWGLVSMVNFPGLVKYHAKHTAGNDRRTLAVSNLRSFSFTASQLAGGWVPTTSWFTQQTYGSGSVVAVDVVSVESGEEGGMMIVFGWQDGVLSREEADGIREKVEGWLAWLVKEGEANV